MAKKQNVTESVTDLQLPDTTQYDKFELFDASHDTQELSGEAIQLFYIPLHQAVLWEENPKNHDIGAICESIEKYGFRDPPSWDAQLQGLVEGNGRTHALTMMKKQGKPCPRGILQHKEEGWWCIPILFGVDAVSKVIAERYAIDHNNLTLMGGDFTVFDMEKMWNREMYLQILQRSNEDGDMPVSVDFDDLQILMSGGFNIDEIEENETESNAGLDEPMNKNGKIIINIGNIDDIDVVYAEIEELLDEHPEWGAEATLN